MLSVALERYTVEDFLGEGSYGTVFSVRDQITQILYAMKVIQLKDNEINPRMAREMAILFELKHSHIVRLEHAFVKDMSLFLIMEYVDDNLDQFIKLRKYGPANVKKWLREMLSAVAYLHERKIIHRDLKPQNILVNSSSEELKIADFGLARGWFKDIQLTPQVATLRYRAPEVLLGSENYTCAIDMWSIGCIFAELADFVFPFRGVSDSPSDPGSIEEIIQNIFQKLGTPTEASWPGVTSYLNFPDVIPMHTAETNNISQHLDADGNDLLRRLLCLNPTQRITAEDALKHPYLVKKEA